jgi:hypothetical protein
LKPLVIFLAIITVGFGALALITSATRSTDRIFVVVDSSFAMTEVWSDVDDELRAINDRDHAEFALATEKEFVHSWQADLRLSGVVPFAPCTFEGIEAHAAVAEADELILITTAASCDPAAFTDWDVILLEP